MRYKEIICETNKPRPLGKRMGNDLYVHKDYAIQAGVPAGLLKAAASKLPSDFDYTAVKYNKKDGAISFIHSPNFDDANEPIVGKSIKVSADGQVKVTNPSKDPLIWHHKHEWVPDDYHGFDTARSKERSSLWKSVLGVNKDISSRIGRQSYWNNWLDQNKLPR